MRNRFPVTLLFTVLLAGACRKAANSTAIPATPATPANTAYLKQTIVYKSLPAIDVNLLSLDLYGYADVATAKPVVIYVHGGGWAVGDKANKLENKLALFNALGYVFISVNYRLSPAPAQLQNASRIKYPDHNNDVADAVKWVIDSIAKYGGNPEKIVLLGHSAGAHLVSLTGTSERFLPVRGIALSRLKGIASIDTEGYDVTTQSGEELYQNAFGTDNAVQKEASPIYNLTAGNSYPKFFVAKRGNAGRITLANDFIAGLQSAGVTVSVVDGSLYDHEGINNAIGDEADVTVTPALKTFLEACFQ